MPPLSTLLSILRSSFKPLEVCAGLRYEFQPSLMIDQQNSTVEDLVRVFNTALVTSRVESGRAYADEMMDMVRTPAFRALLNSIRQLAQEQGISERTAAEQIIHSFRKMDALWTDYLIQEGVQRLKGPASH